MRDLDENFLVCQNPDCKVLDMTIPVGLVPISTGALISLMSHIDKRISELPNILTKERQGRKSAYTEMGMIVLSALRNLGFELKDGKMVIRHVKNPVIKE
jgi:hypothetical protein